MEWIYEVIKDFQALIAGILAIGAAYVAYRGAIRQARATALAATENRTEARRAAAAGFLAELSHCDRVLTAIIQNLQAWNAEYHRIPVQRIDIGIFEANQAAVGLLPADEAYHVALAYKLVRDISDEFGRVLTGERFAVGVLREHFIDQATEVRRVVRKSVEGIRETAGLEEEKAAAIASVTSTSE